MSIINSLLISVRGELNDMQGNVYSNFTLMEQYNKGNKILRNTILYHLPMQLAEEISGTVDAGDSITMPKKPIKLLDVRVNKRNITKVSISEIPDRTANGEPRFYYLLNTGTIKLYPLPDKTYSYDITYIPESVTMLETDDSGYQTDVEELLIKYIVASLTGNGFDMVAEYNSSVGRLLGGIETGTLVVNGYHNVVSSRGDYSC